SPPFRVSASVWSVWRLALLVCVAVEGGSRVTPKNPQDLFSKNRVFFEDIAFFYKNHTLMEQWFVTAWLNWWNITDATSLISEAKRYMLSYPQTYPQVRRSLHPNHPGITRASVTPDRCFTAPLFCFTLPGHHV
ncbi:hypothetical protein, partial [Tateyamaria sp.]|uniref:hypothetical protein n=1 Tax=Tateyamaria sp. TaxID=1929288 RepID=UPI0032A12EEF